MKEASKSTSMRVLVCGSRDYPRKARIASRIAMLSPGTTVIHGAARGPDRIAGAYAESLGFEVEEYPADWERLGKRAGIIRNLDMLDACPDLVIAFWDGDSAGTKHTITEARKRGIPVEVIESGL